MVVYSFLMRPSRGARKEKHVSHIVQAKTSIVSPDLNLLRQAVEIVAGAHAGGRVEDHIKDFYGKSVPVNTNLAIFTKEVHRGIGIKLTNKGEMEFTGDDWDVEEQYKSLQREITQTYVSICMMKSLQQMGYASQAEQEDRQVVIRGTMYA